MFKKMLSAYILSVTFLLFSTHAFSMDWNERKEKMDALQNMEIQKINAVMNYCDINFSTFAKAKLNQVAERFLEDLIDKLGQRAYLVINKDQYVEIFIKKMLNKYIYNQQINQCNFEQLEIAIGSFVDHLQEALTDKNFTSANSRQQIGFLDAVNEVFLENTRIQQIRFSLGMKPVPSLESKPLSHKHSQGPCVKCDRDVGTEWFGDALYCALCRPF